MKKLRILALLHADLVPPQTIPRDVAPSKQAWKVEYQVITALRRLGHEVRVLGLHDELLPIRQAIEAWKPHIAFNLLEHFSDRVIFDQHVVSYLELMRLPYTGCNPRGLTLARDKALAKKVLTYHRVPVPSFVVFPLGRKIRIPKRLRFPVIVKSLIEEASIGISQASVVDAQDKLIERIDFVHHKVGTDAIVEQFIKGRELYVAVLGNQRLEVFPTWEMVFRDLPSTAPRIATAKVKFDVAYQRRHGITTKAARLAPEQEKRLARRSRRIYRALSQSGYARLDYRLGEDGEFYLLEVNPNPNIASDEDYADAAKAKGLSYDALLQRIVALGLRRGARL